MHSCHSALWRQVKTTLSRYCFNAFMKKKLALFSSKPNVCQAPSSLFGHKHSFMDQSKKTKDKWFCSVQHNFILAHPLCKTFFYFGKFFSALSWVFLQKKFKWQKLLDETWQIFRRENSMITGQISNGNIYLQFHFFTQILNSDKRS
jgi:hypothetical protein